MERCGTAIRLRNPIGVIVMVDSCCEWLNRSCEEKASEGWKILIFDVIMLNLFLPS